MSALTWKTNGNYTRGMATALESQRRASQGVVNSFGKLGGMFDHYVSKKRDRDTNAAVSALMQAAPEERNDVMAEHSGSYVDASKVFDLHSKLATMDRAIAQEERQATVFDQKQASNEVLRKIAKDPNKLHSIMQDTDLSNMDGAALANMAITDEGTQYKRGIEAEKTQRLLVDKQNERIKEANSEEQAAAIAAHRDPVLKELLPYPGLEGITAGKTQSYSAPFIQAASQQGNSVTASNSTGTPAAPLVAGTDQVPGTDNYVYGADQPDENGDIMWPNPMMLEGDAANYSVGSEGEETPVEPGAALMEAVDPQATQEAQVFKEGLLKMGVAPEQASAMLDQAIAMKQQNDQSIVAQDASTLQQRSQADEKARKQFDTRSAVQRQFEKITSDMPDDPSFSPAIEARIGTDIRNYNREYVKGNEKGMKSAGKAIEGTYRKYVNDVLSPKAIRNLGESLTGLILNKDPANLSEKELFSTLNRMSEANKEKLANSGGVASIGAKLETVQQQIKDSLPENIENREKVLDRIFKEAGITGLLKKIEDVKTYKGALQKLQNKNILDKAETAQKTRETFIQDNSTNPIKDEDFPVLSDQRGIMEDMEMSVPKQFPILDTDSRLKAAILNKAKQKVAPYISGRRLFSENPLVADFRSPDYGKITKPAELKLIYAQAIADGIREIQDKTGGAAYTDRKQYANFMKSSTKKNLEKAQLDAETSAGGLSKERLMHLSKRAADHFINPDKAIMDDFRSVRQAAKPFGGEATATRWNENAPVRQQGTNFITSLMEAAASGSEKAAKILDDMRKKAEILDRNLSYNRKEAFKGFESN